MKPHQMRSAGTMSFLLLASFFSRATAEESSASFEYPRPTMTGLAMLNINIYDTVEIAWRSNYEETWLYVWCDTGITWFDKRVKSNDFLNFSPAKDINTDRDWSQPHHCWLHLIYEREGNKGLNGAEMMLTSYKPTALTTFASDTTIVSTLASSVTLSLGSASAIATDITSRSTPTPGPSSTSPSSAFSRSGLPVISVGPVSSSSSGLSAGAKAGIAVGVIVGVSAFAGLLYIFLRYRRKLREVQARLDADAAAMGMSKHQPPLPYYSDVPVEDVPLDAPLELSGSPLRLEAAELPAAAVTDGDRPK